MASLLRTSRKIYNSVNVQRCCSPFGTSTIHRSKDAGHPVDAPVIDAEKALKSKAYEQKERLKNYITVQDTELLAPINPVSEELLKNRRVRIYKPPKNAMQSGTDNTHNWQMEFDTQERWENPLMGWTSSGDPISNVKINFETVEEAIEFCKKNGWKWYVQDKPTERPMKPKSYAANYSWNTNTRVSTK